VNFFLHRFPAVFLLLAVQLAPAEPAQTVAYTEYQIKAAFLFNFTQFIEWPTNAFADADAPLVIGILGNDPFGGALSQTIEGETVRGRKVVLRTFKRPEEARACHLLFISRSEQSRLSQVLAALKDTPVVTVSDADQFVRRGGMIGFVMIENKVRFDINPQTAAKAGLKISSKLLKLASNLYSESGREGA
jgi:hypothetical protein